MPDTRAKKISSGASPKEILGQGLTAIELTATHAGTAVQTLVTGSASDG